jgi:hypothetical protein
MWPSWEKIQDHDALTFRNSAIRHQALQNIAGGLCATLCSLRLQKKGARNGLVLVLHLTEKYKKIQSKIPLCGAWWSLQII